MALNTNTNKEHKQSDERDDCNGTGVEYRIQCLSDESDRNSAVVSQLKAQNKLLLAEMEIMKGYVIRVEQRVYSQQNQITDLTSRGMRENLIINGMKDSKIKLNKFIVKSLGITESKIMIDRIHRFGQKSKGNPRPIVAKFHDYSEKELILEKARELKT
ncbi:hypothetical protein KUTeg_006076 [Tegillarca granosa]|uniref:Uncharacterized protein n=1 Tax=Tegillarca granosa TaxID=220873 RepID=A0ABQ9FJF5_TEGGR|nr:hypothetical protein KUTeg_006076 [Tegillarca granosa]